MANSMLEQLIEGAMARLEEIGYSPGTVNNFRKRASSFARYVESVGRDEWSEGLVRDYILARYKCDIEAGQKLTPPAQRAKRACLVLGHFAATGDIPGRSARPRVAPKRFRPLLELYIAECVERGLSESTVVGRHRDICDFLNFIDGRGVGRVSDISKADVDAFVAERHERAPGSMRRLAPAVRSFLVYAYSHGITERDLSHLVPKASRYPRKPLVKVWTKDEISILLGSINRAESTGKRDFAIILLAATYGLRRGDILGLELGDIDWDRGEIRLVQRKTGVPNTLPITEQVGWAIADWLRNGRPGQAACRNVFTKVVAPYGPLTSIDRSLKARMAAAGVERDPGASSGLHSLRHSVATRMLSEGVSLPVISSVLGHSAESSTAVYLHSDIEGLRRCALELEGADDEE